MKVRVKDGKTGFIYGVLRNEGEEFTLKAVKGLRDGKPVTITVNQQFSEIWMDKIPAKTKEKAEPEAKKPEVKKSEKK